MDMSSREILASGTSLYDGKVPCRIVLVREDCIPGSGDYEDPPEIREDREVACVAVWHEAAGTPGVFNCCRGYYLTLEEAQ